MNKKLNILEYIEITLDTFDIKPFNEIDALILSQFSYLNFENFVPSIDDNQDLINVYTLYKSEFFDELVHKTLSPKSNLELIRVLCASPRFRDIGMNFHENICDKNSEEQFSATTFFLPTNEIVISFRGTDLSVTGWKEDFNMSFLCPVPSQVSALNYLEKVCLKTSSDIYVTGHSKGGNLATYSSSFCKNDLKHRIKNVFNFDGPGFPTDILENTEYLNEQEKITKIVPEGSIVGILFENSNSTKIIKSNNFSLLQHDPFSWVCDNDQFIQSNDFDFNVKYMDKSLNTYLYSMDIPKRKILVDTLFSIINSVDAETLDEISSKVFTNRVAIATALKNIDPVSAKCISELFSSYIKISIGSFFDVSQKENRRKLNMSISTIRNKFRFK